MSMFQRIHDWRHERYIRRLTNSCKTAYAASDKPMACLYWGMLVTAIALRSTAQIMRMESSKGLGVRKSIKVGLMDAFLRGRIPSTFVTAAFRLLRLRSL